MCPFLPPSSPSLPPHLHSLPPHLHSLPSPLHTTKTRRVSCRQLMMNCADRRSIAVWHMPCSWSEYHRSTGKGTHSTVQRVSGSFWNPQLQGNEVLSVQHRPSTLVLQRFSGCLTKIHSKNWRMCVSVAYGNKLCTSSPSWELDRWCVCSQAGCLCVNSEGTHCALCHQCACTNIWTGSWSSILKISV